MGNNGSQSENVAEPEEQEQWTQSFPRMLRSQRLQNYKVLPEVIGDVQQKLRPTNNGEILYSGGTISGRHCRHQSSQSLPREQSSHVKKFGSVPDLRGKNEVGKNTEIREITRGRKKYKAPPPPNVISNEPSFDSWNMETNGDSLNICLRKVRLYKTRTEIKNNLRNNYKEKDNNKISHSKSKELPRNEKKEINDVNKLCLAKLKSKSLPEFQEELRGTPKKTSYSKNKNKLKTLDHNISKMEHFNYKMVDYENHYKKITQKDIENESTNIIKNNEKYFDFKNTIEQQPQEQPSNTFYFGMNDSNEPTSCIKNNVDNITFNVKKYNYITQIYNETELNNDVCVHDTQFYNKDISLNLRPILPKKQLEIPRFSPTVAWKLLSIFDANPSPSIVSDECPVLIEDRIEKLSQMPPLLSIPGAEPRSSHAKSGDSGISGDAGPLVFEDNSEPFMISKCDNVEIPSGTCDFNISWTPQQDLEDEESNSESGPNNNRYIKNVSNIYFSPQSHVFSLSLPRDNHLAAYMEEKARQHNHQNISNLQRLKRSVSGVLNNFGNKKTDQITTSQDHNNNWFLSHSTLNSLNSGIYSSELHLSKYSNDSAQLDSSGGRISMVPMSVNNNNNNNNGRVIYLPECKENRKFNCFQNESNENIPIKYSMKNSNFSRTPTKNCVKLSNDENQFFHLSKSCENISFSSENGLFSQPENLQDPPAVEIKQWKSHKSKKFTFQSTVRQIERKKMAEKLSKEAEQKEQQRLSELEAMRKVEEEFQRKRAKEKASIRQQLRLFSLDDTASSHLPINWNRINIPSRTEPDGAVSSSTSSPILANINKSNHFKAQKVDCKIPETISNKLPVNKVLYRQESDGSYDSKVKAQVTQVLSEYRQSRREYKDYRFSSRFFGERSDSPFQERNTTVHPKITLNMPKVQSQDVIVHMG